MQAQTDEGFRLSPQQRHLWLCQQAGPESIYSAQVAVRITGELNRDRLIESLRRTVQSHEILRTQFKMLSWMTLPIQMITGWGDVKLLEHDVSSLAPAEVDSAIATLVRQAADSPVDLERDSALQVSLIAVEPHLHILLLTLPALCADQTTMRNLVREITDRYGLSEKSWEEPLQYADLAEYQNELLESDRTSAGRQYWSEKRLAGSAPINPPLSLAFEKQSAARPFRPRCIGKSVDRNLLDEMRSQVELYDISVEAFCLSVWFVLLFRHIQQEVIVVGVSSDSARPDEMKQALGLFARYLPLVISLDGKRPFSHVMSAVEDELRQVLKRQDYFDYDLIRNPKGESGVAASIPFVFDFAEETVGNPSAGVSFSLSKCHAYFSRFKIGLYIELKREGISINWHFDENAYEAEEVERLCSQLIQLIRSAVGHPEWAIERLNVVSGDERRLVAVRFNQTGADYRSDGCIHQLISEQAECRPDTLAVVCGEENLTYGELNRRSQRLARRLRGRGIGPEAIVGICLGRSLLMIEAVLGVLKAGAAYLPLDPSNPKQRLSFMLADGGAELVLTESGVLEQLGDWAGAAITLDGAGEQMDMPEEGIESGAGSRNAAYVIYTSGSTGKPKGVVVEHRSALNLLEGLKAAVYPGEALHGVRVSLNAPLSFDASMQQIVMLMSGATLCVIEDYMRQDPPELIAYIGTEGIEAMDCTPSQMGMLVQAGLLERSPGRPRKLLIAGEEIDQGLWQALAGDTSRESYNIYGPTESTVDVTVSRMEPEKRRSDIGRPMVNYRVYVRELGGELGGTWMKGEIEVGGPGVARGYLKRPDLTAERFVPESEGREAGGRVYRTGDMGRYLPGGAVEYLGRKDQQLKLRGYRIEPGEIEAALRTHEAVGEALVTVRHEEGGPGRLVAYILPRTNRRGQKMDQPHSPGFKLPNGLEIEQLNWNETRLLYKEIFEDRVYLRHGITIEKGDSIFDVGANIGMFSLFAHEICDDVRIHAFEPIDPICATLDTNLRRHGVNAKIHQCGLSSRRRQARFTYYPQSSTTSGMYADPDEEERLTRAFIANQGEGVAKYADEFVRGRFSAEDVLCETKTISDVVRENSVAQIDLLKIDVEKSELDVLEGIQDDDWRKIKQLAIETHDVNGRVAQISEMLQRRGYEVHIDQSDSLRNTDVYNIYAVHPTRRQSGKGNAPAPSASANGNGELNAAALQKYLGDRLPEYMVPKAYVMLERLPLTPNGKIDLQKLPSFEEARPGTAARYAGPRNDVERKLCDIWANVLGLDRVGIHDNFFALGGDSILSIQIIARANQAGLHLTPMQLFQHRTVATLAQVAHIREAIEAERGLVMGTAPLTPIQRWFFDQTFPDSHHFNQAVLLKIGCTIDAWTLGTLIRHLVMHHDALRLRFVQDELGVHQSFGDVDGSVSWVSVDISGLAQDREPAVFAQIATDAQTSLDLARGPLMRAIIFGLGPDEPARLLLVVHHLVVDGVSWRILLEDLQATFRQVREGQALDLPAKTTSFKQWAAGLESLVDTGALDQEIAYWTESRGDVARLPVDFPEGRNDEASAQNVGIELTVEETRVLLQEVPRAYNTQINDVLLAALAQALSTWTESGRLLVDLEGHGREEIISDVDVSRTVGWFTAQVPVLLTFERDARPEAALTAVKQQLRRVPRRGIGYGLLRYMSRDGETGRVLAALPEPEVSFNYLGQLDQVVSGEGVFTPLGGPVGPLRSPLACRSHLIEINACVARGRFAADWVFSGSKHGLDTVQDLATRFADSLRAIIDHCRSGGVTGYTAADFPLAQLEGHSLEEIFGSVEFEAE
jgi:amino acid adenylation domain-containing protein/non-ribosomal peptide synthase protein (TIGR01720 family)/FkbM family methyltransferase